MADTLQYRQITGLFTARLPDGSDADEHPDTVRLSGRVTFHPEYKKPLVFPGEHIVLEPIPALLVDGQLMVEVLQGDDVVLQDLWLPVTVDERANQSWAWRMVFDHVTLGQYGDEVSLPDRRFPVEEGEGPLDLSDVAGTWSGGTLITRGPRGYGITDITAQNGELTFAWEDGAEHSVPMPESVPGPPGPKGDPGTIAYEGIEPIVVDGETVTVGGVDVTKGLKADEIGARHLDEFVKPGSYSQAYSSYASPANGYPGTSAGRLIVLASPSGTQVTQVFIEFAASSSPACFVRNYYQGWGEWAKFNVDGGGGGGTGSFLRGVVPDGTDVNTLTEPGVYSVPSTSAAASLINYPTGRGGTIIVASNEGSSIITQDVLAHVSTTAPPERYVRSWLRSGSTGWSPWSSAEWVKGRIPTGTNVDTFRGIGAWVVVSSGSASGLPGSGTGTLEVVTISGSGMSLQRFTERETSGGVRVWHRYSLSAAGWAGVGWVPMNPQQEPETGPGEHAVQADVQVSDHATRVQYARSRRGGGIGTGGKAIVMLRFDHWLQAFKDDILPILREFSLPGTLNVNYDNLSLPANGGGSITWEHVQAWNQYDGIEIANHGATHTGGTETTPVTAAAIYHEVVEGRRLLEAAMPRVAVETWQEHGSAYMRASDIDGDIGLMLGRELRNFTESYAGRLVMAEHAVVEGKSGGFYHPINGHPQIGQSHMSIDKSTAAQAIEWAQTAQTFKRGVTLYVHPGTIGTGGDYMTLADFRTVCEFLAAERDAGRLMIMTAAGGAFADKNHDRRENLLVNPEFAGDLTGQWSFTSGWTFSDGTATSGPTAAALSQAMLLYTRFGWAMGAAHEMVVNVRADTPTTLTLSMEQLGNPANWKAERVFEIPGDGVARDYRLNLSLPRDRAVSQMRIYLGGPNLTITRPPLLAAI